MPIAKAPGSGDAGQQSISTHDAGALSATEGVINMTDGVSPIEERVSSEGRSSLQLRELVKV